MTEEKLKIYRKAFVEVLAVLSCLERDEYVKIPYDFIENLEKNKDKDYVYEYDRSIDLADWKLMPESRAILYIILRDYLSDPEEREYYEAREAREEEQLRREEETD